MTFGREERLSSAVRAVSLVSDELGLEQVQPRLLRDSTHLSFKLSPLPIVARVLTSIEPWQVERAQRERDVCEFLASRNAPVVAPLEDGSGPHVVGDCLVTLWKFVENEGVPDAPHAGRALARSHEVLASYGQDLPSFMEALEDARRLLDDGDLGPLTRVDRAFLREEYERLRTITDDNKSTWKPIHGDAHLGNALATADGPLWTDWESVAFGPLEWELSSLPQAAWSAWPALDEELLNVARDLRSACVSVWCWALYDRGVEKLDAARHHLDRLKAKAHRE